MSNSVTSEPDQLAQKALMASPNYDLHALRVERDSNRLVITGCVTSYYHKQLAQEIVRAVAHDLEVVNKAEVPKDVAASKSFS